MSHCLASVTDNVGAAVALVPQLFAGPARQSLVLIVLLHGLNVLLRIHVLTAQVRRLSGLTESSLAGCSVHRDNLICRNTLFLTKPPLARRPIPRDNLILHLLPRLGVSFAVVVPLWLNKVVGRLLITSAKPDRGPWNNAVFDWLDSIVVAYHPFG